MTRQPQSPTRRASIVTVLAEVERRAGHPDPEVRANILADVWDEIDALSMARSEACSAAGVPPGRLGDGTLSTDRLREVLATVRALPR